MTRRLGLPVVLALMVLLGAACTGNAVVPDHTRSPSAGGGPVSLPSSPEALPLADMAGYTGLLSSLHGTPVLVNVWASWCGPCRDEAPLLAAAAAAHPDIQFVGVDIQDSKGGAVGFIREFSLPYPSLFNPTGDIRDALGLPGQPDTLFYDAAGVLQKQILGPLDETTLKQGLAKITP